MPEASILFVDDDAAVLSSMKRMLHPFRSKWSMFFAISGEEALGIMSENKMDVVVSDMRMPGMNGAQLLGKIKIRHPQVARIILSGHSEKQLAILAINVAHQFLNKPCSLEELSAVISKTISLRTLLASPRLCELANGVVQMPSLPEHYVAITRELNSDEPDVERISGIIEEDPAMTISVLRLVNSGFFGLPSRIDTVPEAIGLLGLELLGNLTLATGLFRKYESATHFSIESFTRRALCVGTLARKLAAEAGAPKPVVEKSFISGMLCDVGQLMLNTTMGDDYGKILEKLSQDENGSIARIEKEQFGTSHAEIGAYLMGLWGFDDNIVEAVAYHHHPSDSVNTPGAKPLIFVHAADALVKKYCKNGTCTKKLDMEYIARHGLETKVELWKQMAKSLTD